MTDDPNDRDIEAPEADVVEQALDADPNEQDEGGAASASIEAPEWDAQEQSRSVPLEDEYR